MELRKDLTLNDFIQEFKAYNRDNFTYDGYEQLYELCEELEITDLDVVALDCEFAQVTREDLYEDYSSYIDDIDTQGLEEDEIHDVLIERLNKATIIIPLDNGDVLLSRVF